MNNLNKTITSKKVGYGYILFFAAALILLVGMVVMARPVRAATFVLLTAQLDYGQTSNNVTNLQIFLASNPNIYPQGRVTGYFGPLTKSAVMNFQNAYGIPQVGRVGPATLAKINSLIASGVGLGGAGGIGYGNNTISPMIGSVSLTKTNTSVTIGSFTSEPTKTMIYYSTSPFQLAEATSQFSRPTIVGGTVTLQTTAYQNNQSTTITNLQPQTNYYYMIEAVDADGNFSYTWPALFATN